MLVTPTPVLFGQNYTQYIHYVDVVSNTLLYEGWAPQGSDVADPVWTIRKIEQADATTQVEQWAPVQYATAKWSLRTTYFNVIPVPPYTNLFSVNFDGINDYIDCSQPELLLFDGSNPFTVSLWVRTSSAAINPILSKWQGTNGTVFFIFPDGRIWFYIRTAENTNDLVLFSNSAVDVSGNTWQHVAISYDGSLSAAGVKIYIDGVLSTNTVQSDTLSSANTTTSVPLMIGAYASVYYFKGNIDELSIYYTNLTDFQIEQIYNSGVPTDISIFTDYALCSNWYRMGDDSTFPNIKDVKSNKTGVMINMIASQIQGVVP